MYFFKTLVVSIQLLILQLVFFHKGHQSCQFLFWFRNPLKRIILGLHVRVIVIHCGSTTLPFFSMSIILPLSGFEKKWLLCGLIGNHLGKGIIYHLPLDVGQYCMPLNSSTTTFLIIARGGWMHHHVVGDFSGGHFLAQPSMRELSF